MFILASIPASCRALANIGFMVSVLETGIEEVFARHSPQTEGTGTHSDVGWSQIVPGFSVPELSQDSFINGELETEKQYSTRGRGRGGDGRGAV